MLPLLQGDQDGYLRELDASAILAIHGESSGHVYLCGAHKLIRKSHRWFEVMCYQDGYLRELDASEVLAIRGESSGHVYLYCVHKLIRISHRWFEVICCLCYRMTRMVT